jgi:hypothetical protein
MKCDFCNKEFIHEPQIIHRSIQNSSCGQNATKITCNFCSRTCMIAEKINSLLLSLSDEREGISKGEDLASIIKKDVMQITGCTDREYKDGLQRFKETETKSQNLSF